MADTLPLLKKKNLNSRRTTHRDPIEVDDEDAVFPIHLLIMMPNTIGSFVSAYRRNDNDYFLPVFSLLFFTTLLSSECLSRYQKMPKNEKSSRKFLLKLTIWFLYSAMSVGFVYLFTFLITSQITVALYAAVVMCSVFSLYVFIILDLINDWKIRSSSEDEIRVLDNQTPDAGKYNYSDSVLETVSCDSIVAASCVLQVQGQGNFHDIAECN